MTTLIVGMALFFGIHVLTSTPLRSVLVGPIGEKPYKGAFSLISLVGLGLMIWGFGMSRYGPDSARIVFNPPAWGPSITLVFVLVGVIVIGSGHGRGHIRKLVKQPMAVGFALWSIGHLFSNGNLNEVMLFGGFLVYAVYDFIVSTAEGKSPKHHPNVKSDIKAIVIGGIIFAVVLFFHFNLFGVSTR